MANISPILEIQGLEASINDTPVIKGLNLTVNPGEIHAIMGKNGSGKSTLVNLMCRFYDLSDGSITLDGVDIKQLKVADYRRQIGLVLQEPFLFFGTIADNIAYGMPEATRDQIVAAARAAHAHEFILRMPQGYDSLVGERGQGLSGGERQRVAIARALASQPRLLLLDEPFAALGPALKADLLGLVADLAAEAGTTVILVTHDPADAHRFAGGVALVHDGVADAPVATDAIFANPPPALRDYLG